jgi:hypothetical protein
MRFNRSLRAGFALLFALLLPLQGYAAMPACREAAVATSVPQAHCAGAPAVHRATLDHTILHHHNCDNCCCGAAMVLTADDFIAPRLTAPDISDTALWPPPAVAIDRLDRPPRFIPA